MTASITGQVWGENVDAVRDYLLREAEQPLGVLRPRLDAAYAAFRATVAGVSDEQAQFVPSAGESEDSWGIAEVVRHIVSVEPVMAERVRLIGTGQSAAGITRTHPGYLAVVDTHHVADLLQALDRFHAALDSAIVAIEGGERLDTLRFRLKRIAELLGGEWPHGQLRFQVELVLRLLEVQALRARQEARSRFTPPSRTGTV